MLGVTGDLVPGIYITRGMTVSIPSFSIRIGEDGQLESDPVTLHVRFDVCPTWIQIAKRHLETALLAQSERQQVWAGSNEDAKAQALESEFEACLLYTSPSPRDKRQSRMPSSA